jgi:hypothetical protein
MSGVVLRCPNCGTVQGNPGKCDACHEASVRYFCTNHDPGRWLESSTCSECGQRFEEAGPAPQIPTPRPDRTAVHPPAASSVWTPAASPPRLSKGAPARPDISIGRAAAARDALPRRWPGLPRSTSGIHRAPDGPPAPVRSFALGGTFSVLLKRLLLLALVLMVVFFASIFLLGGPLLQLLLQILLQS